MDSEVQLLHRALVDAIARCRPDVESQPVTVSEILNELLPYRSARTLVGFEMNADYEHALMRLLAGVDGLVRLEPEDAREHLAREMAAPNPDVKVVREYGAFNVWVSAPEPSAGEPNGSGREGDWVTPGWLSELTDAPPAPGPARTEPWSDVEPKLTEDAPPEPWADLPSMPELELLPREAQPNEAAGSPTRTHAAAAKASARTEAAPAPPPEAPAPSAAPAPAPLTPPRARSARKAVAEAPAAAAPAPAASAAPAPAAAPAPGPGAAGRLEANATPVAGAAVAPVPSPAATPGAGCVFCHEALPQERAVRYCPFCGADQQLRPCPRCGETLEAAWRYCVACGAAVPASVP